MTFIPVKFTSQLLMVWGFELLRDRQSKVCFVTHVCMCECLGVGVQISIHHTSLESSL